MRAEVDVMTLSATPIPRTLHMALAGVRDMSVIHTPPEARLPVKTFVSEDSAEPVREAILRELERDGQVFFLHNRVRTIHNVADELAKLIPEARFAWGMVRCRNGAGRGDGGIRQPGRGRTSLHHHH